LCRLPHAVNALAACSALRRLRFEHNADMTEALPWDVACLEHLECFSMVDFGCAARSRYALSDKL